MGDDLASTAPNPQLPRLAMGELLGRGTATEVYRAHDHVLDRQVAVKVFHPHRHPAACLRFDAEAYALARLSHPSLVSIFDIGTLDESPYLVMQLIDGVSLASRLITGPLPEPTVLRMGAALADGLAHAHEHGVVHCGVKPASVLLDRDDAPHLTDFGAALLTDELAADEQADGELVGPAVDVHALGMVLLECLNGECVARPETGLTGGCGTPRIPANLSPGLTDLLTAMTAREPGRRPSAADCAQRLLALEAGTLETSRQESEQTTCSVMSVVAPESDDTGRTVAVPRQRGASATMSHARRPVVMLAIAATITAAVTLTLANMARPVHGRPSASVVVGAQSSHGTARTSSTASIPAGVRAASTSVPDGMLLATPVVGHGSVAAVHQLPESTEMSPPVSSLAVPPPTTPIPTSQPGSTPTATPAPTTEPSPSDATTGNPGAGNP